MPVHVLAGAFLFNLGQGALRPAMPLYLQATFAASYRMVTAIPAVFGVGKWLASLPTGALMDRVGRRPLMIGGLLTIAGCDVASAVTADYGVFLALRALAGVGWAMFGTVAMTAMVRVPARQRRGRAVSALLVSETLGLLLGTSLGGVLYEDVAPLSPFTFEAACMVLAAVVVAGWRAPVLPRSPAAPGRPGWQALGVVLRTPGVPLMGLVSAVLIAIQAGVLVFLFPLHLADRGGLSPQTVGVVVSLGVLGRLPALWLGGSLSDRYGRTRVLGPGLLVFGLLLAVLPLVTDPVALGLCSLALGVASGVVAPIPTALVADRVPGAHHGLAVGWLRTATDSGHVVGPLAMGVLADALHLSAPFLISAALLLGLAGGCRRQTGVVAAGSRD